MEGHGRDLEEQFGRRSDVKEQGPLGFELWEMETEAYHEEYLAASNVSPLGVERGHHQWPLSGEFRATHSGPCADFLLGHPEFGGYGVRLVSHPMEAKMRLEIKARHKKEEEKRTC